MFEQIKKQTPSSGKGGESKKFSSLKPPSIEDIEKKVAEERMRQKKEKRSRQCCGCGC